MSLIPDQEHRWHWGAYVRDDDDDRGYWHRAPDNRLLWLIKTPGQKGWEVRDAHFDEGLLLNSDGVIQAGFPTLRAAKVYAEAIYDHAQQVAVS